MAWICQQEGIEADPEALAVLAAAGEGSVRDSLSALDQAIACCGDKLNAAEVRALLGAFSLESLEKVTQALADGDSRSMLEVVDELERNGQNLQHFSRELSRYFRNLLVTRVAGADTRLVAASAAQREKLAQDRRRVLRRGPDPLPATLARSLQRSASSRCSPASTWRSAWCAWCRPAACCPSNRRWRVSAPAAAHCAAAPLAPPPPAPAAAAPSACRQPRRAPALRRSNWIAPRRRARGRPNRNPRAPTRSRRKPTRRRWPPATRASACTPGCTKKASPTWPTPWRTPRITIAGGDLNVVAPKSYALYFKDRGFEEAVREVFGRPLRIKFTTGEAAARPAPISLAAPPKADDEDEVTGRALANPEVQRFREVFGGEVRKVRNLKE